jgi:FkbM family methyltransferase
MNTWKILKQEKDLPMINFSQNKVDSDAWHDNATQYLVENFLISKQTCIDIGASYGWFSIPFSKYFKKVVSFEPHKGVYECFLKNIENANCKNIESYNFACSNKNEKMFFQANASTGRSQVVDYNTQIRVKTKTIDSYYFQNVDLIKIDVEGHEDKVLQGAKETIIFNKPVIMVEIHCTRSQESFLHRQKIFNFLNELEYKIVDVRKNDFIFKYK